MSAAMVDGWIIEGYADSGTTLKRVKKTTGERGTLSLSNPAKPLLKRYGSADVTAATGDILIAADPETRKLYSVSHDQAASPATFKIREYQINANATAADFVADHTVTLPGQMAFGLFDGVFAARGQLFLMEFYGGTRVVRVGPTDAGDLECPVSE